MVINEKSSMYNEDKTGLKVYSANPWFTDEQMERSEYMRETLDKLGFNVFDPKSANLVPPDSDADWRESAFKGNLDAIDEADFVLAITDGKDMGVCFEVGYAYSQGVPIVYFAETLGDNKFNLMLAQSGIHVITSRDQLEKDLVNEDLCSCIINKTKFSDYDGMIE